MGPSVARVLVVDHYDSYTYNLVHLIAASTGVLPDVVQHDDPASPGRWQDRYTHIVLSPGPGSVRNDSDFSLGRAIIASSPVPVLGVCLGMQAIVHEMGGEVSQVEPAHGEVAVVQHTGTGVFAAVPSEFRAVRYHSHAAVSVPECLDTTAWCDGPSGRVVMGVRHRTRQLHGVQFHPESALTEHGGVLITNFLAMS